LLSVASQLLSLELTCVIFQRRVFRGPTVCHRTIVIIMIRQFIRRRNMSMKSIKNLGAWARFGGPVPPTGPSLKPLLVLIMHCVTVVISVFIALAKLLYF